MESRDFHRFDHIIAMDDENLRLLRRAAPAGAAAELALIMDFAADLGDDA